MITKTISKFFIPVDQENNFDEVFILFKRCFRNIFKLSEKNIFYLHIIVVYIRNSGSSINLGSLKGSVNIKLSVLQTSVFLFLFCFVLF